MKNLRRVMHFTPYFPPHAGWLEMYVQEWSSQYVQRWWDVCVVTLSPGQWGRVSREENGVKIIVLPAYDIISGFPLPLFFLPSFWRELREAKKWSPEIIHTHTRFFLSSFLWGIFAKSLSLPWIHIEHGSGFVVSNKRIVEQVSRLYDETLWKWTLRHASRVITVSKMCEKFVRESFSVQDVETIYRWILPTHSSVLRDENDISIGYVGRLVDLKWVDILIQSFAKSLWEYEGEKRVTLKIVWDGTERESLEKLVLSLWIQNLVVFLGKRDILEVREKLLPSFHIFVNPSLQEGLPTTVIEALVAGCRVIATDVGGTKEIHERFPFVLVPSSDIDALAQALLWFLRESDMRVFHPDASFFSWDETFEKFSAIYKEI